MSDFTIPGLPVDTGSALQKSMSQATRALQSSGADSDSGKISKAAKQFEAILLSKWLEDAQHAFAAPLGEEDEDDGQNATPGSDQLNAIAMQALATSISNGNGLGIAKMIEGYLGAKGSDNQQVTADKGEESRPSEASKTSGIKDNLGK